MNGTMTKVQGAVSEATAERFKKACDDIPINYQDALGLLTELFVRLPEGQQRSLSLAMRSDKAFEAFMQAVDVTVRDSILARMQWLAKIPGIPEPPAQTAAAEEESGSQQTRRGARRAGG